jgi:hypothetical protein
VISIDGSFQIVKEQENKRGKTPIRLQSVFARSGVRPRLLSLIVSMSGDEWNGGADRDRTGDPLLAKQVLSQLSYSPLLVSPTRTPDRERRAPILEPRHCGTTVVGLGRV